MALQTVNITVRSDAASPAPVDGVIVRVYDGAGSALITSGETGAVTPGVVQLTLDGDSDGVRYQLRFFIEGGSITSPQYIDVIDAVTNNFEIEARLHTLPEAADPRLCRVSGYVRGPDGRYRPGVDLHFIPCFRPVVVGRAVVLGERVAVKSDRNGYVQVDLYRTGYYTATVEGHGNVLREISVPDRSSVELAHLLFPVVAAITYNVAGPYSLAIGATQTIIPTIKASNFQQLEGTAEEDVIWTTDDPSIASIQVLSDRIVIQGNAAGTTTLRAQRRDLGIVYTPDPGIGGGVTSITVA